MTKLYETEFELFLPYCESSRKQHRVIIFSQFCCPLVSSTSTAPHIILSVMNKEATDGKDKFKERLSFEAHNLNTGGMCSGFLLYGNQSLQL